jgi:hypothetical protein
MHAMRTPCLNRTRATAQHCTRRTRATAERCTRRGVLKWRTAPAGHAPGVLRPARPRRHRPTDPATNRGWALSYGRRGVLDRAMAAGPALSRTAPTHGHLPCSCIGASSRSLAICQAPILLCAMDVLLETLISTGTALGSSLAWHGGSALISNWRSHGAGGYPSPPGTLELPTPPSYRTFHWRGTRSLCLFVPCHTRLWIRARLGGIGCVQARRLAPPRLHPCHQARQQQA